MIYPQHISLCTSTIENAGYVNRMSGVVRGRELVTPSYSIKKFLRISYCIKMLREDRTAAERKLPASQSRRRRRISRSEILSCEKGG